MSIAQPAESTGHQFRTTEKLFKEKKFADVWFSFDDESDASIDLVAAHKNLLAAESDVFEAMFYGQLNEKNRVIRMPMSQNRHF